MTTKPKRNRIPVCFTLPRPLAEQLAEFVRLTGGTDKSKVVELALTDYMAQNPPRPRKSG